MAYKTAMTMTIASRRDFHTLVQGLIVLLFFSVFLSSYPVLLLSLTMMLLLTAQQFPGLLFERTPEESGTVEISRNGGLRFSVNEIEAGEGNLHGVQWCTRFLAVLRYRTDSGIRHLVLISAQQRADSFRRLSVWLRHNNKEGSDQS